MSIPDFISPVIAYRVWQWDSIGLKSLNDEPWFPGCKLIAKCLHYWSTGHAVPAYGCSCGIYAARDCAHLKSIGCADYGVHGEVYLWGTVVEHVLGYRAQFAYPKSLVVPVDTIPSNMLEAESRLETLFLYGVDTFIAPPRGNTPIRLWSKQCGLDTAGFDYVMAKSKEWYSSRLRPPIRHGDRVAVHGMGIGIVKQVEDKDVHVLMWNRVILRLLRKKIAWNRQNWRWESDRAEVFMTAAPSTVHLGP